MFTNVRRMIRISRQFIVVVALLLISEGLADQFRFTFNFSSAGNSPSIPEAILSDIIYEYFFHF
jgi:hypothetical protein